jgi:hypothetical protein
VRNALLDRPCSTGDLSPLVQAAYERLAAKAKESFSSLPRISLTAAATAGISAPPHRRAHSCATLSHLGHDLRYIVSFGP